MVLGANGWRFGLGCLVCVIYYLGDEMFWDIMVFECNLTAAHVHYGDAFSFSIGRQTVSLMRVQKQSQLPSPPLQDGAAFKFHSRIFSIFGLLSEVKVKCERLGISGVQTVGIFYILQTNHARERVASRSTWSESIQFFTRIG